MPLPRFSLTFPRFSLTLLAVILLSSILSILTFGLIRQSTWVVHVDTSNDWYPQGRTPWGSSTISTTRSENDSNKVFPSTSTTKEGLLSTNSPLRKNNHHDDSSSNTKTAPNTVLKNEEEASLATSVFDSSNTMMTTHQEKGGYALRISHPDEFLLFDWPTRDALLSDFTIQLWYRTEKRHQSSETVAILSNQRESKDGQKYGREFGLYLEGRTGKIEVYFQGYDSKKRTLANGSIQSMSSKRYDDGVWHRIYVLRNENTIQLSVDGILQGTAAMPIHHDYDGQEQRVLIGGGNDRKFRPCEIDNVQIWTAVRSEAVTTHYRCENHDNTTTTSSSSTNQNDLHDPELMMHLSFDSPTNGVMIHDCAPMGGGAIRVGSHLQGQEAFVPGASGVPVSCEDCNAWPAENKRNPVNQTSIMITYLGVSCDQKGGMFTPGALYQLEAYLGAMWLDLNRLGMRMMVVSECLPPEIVKAYTTPILTFHDIETLHFQVPELCENNHGGPAVGKRFLVFDQMFRQGYFDNYDYVIHIDLRDSRAFHWPTWNSPGQDNNVQLFLQTADGNPGTVCGGYQSGTREAMAKLMQEMAKALIDQKCLMTPDHDQGVLIKLFHNETFGPRSTISLDKGIINSQHTRVFDETAFVHGNWWMSKRSASKRKSVWAYPRGVPYRRGKAWP